MSCIADTRERTEGFGFDSVVIRTHERKVFRAELIFLAIIVEYVSPIACHRALVEVHGTGQIFSRAVSALRFGDESAQVKRRFSFCLLHFAILLLWISALLRWARR